jgi:hypothetical protein
LKKIKDIFRYQDGHKIGRLTTYKDNKWQIDGEAHKNTQLRDRRSGYKRE